MTLIIVDAGHGPNTAGKRSPDGKLREFTFNHAVAMEVQKLLLGQKINVFMTHDTTRDVPLAERMKRANAHKGDAFISIHANAFTSNWHTANGIETYIKRAASKEEKSLAATIQQALVAKTGLRNRGVKQENFYVLTNAKMPAILVECGFMTNKREVALLASANYQKQCAKAIVQGLMEWLK